jgi:hypothetical protein
VDISTDGGANWTRIDGWDHNWSSGWARRQISLASYVNKKIRLLFQTSTSNGRTPWNDMVIDNISVGGVTPSAPYAYSPANLSIVDVLRPTLVVKNAVSYSGSPLTYRFEVYSDADLSNIVAQVPIVASGADRTSWQVDVTLNNNAQYWWRCRGTENGTNVGTWMATASFFANEINNPPWPVIQVIPPHWVLDNTNSSLTWYPTTDPDAGDSIISYHLQVSEQPDFTSMVIDDPNIVIPGTFPQHSSISLPLAYFTGATSLVPGTVYYWRVQALDSRYLYSAWPAGGGLAFAFVYEHHAVTTTVKDLVVGPDHSMIIKWDGATNKVYLEFSPKLEIPDWLTIAGPLSGTQFTIKPQTNAPAGFFRLRLE